MSDLLRPGQTIRLTPPWDTAPPASDDVRIFVQSDSLTLPDWQINSVVGNLASPNLEVDVTLKAGALAPLSSRYRLAVTFGVGYSGGTIRYKTIPVVYDQMTFFNVPRFDIVKWSDVIISAILEPEGLAFYEIEGPISGRKLRSRIETAEWPYLWVDLSNTIWCIARERALPTDSWRWFLYRSRDGAREFEIVSELPLPSQAQYPMGVSQGRDIWIGYSTSTTMEMIRSKEGGETWGEPYSTGASVNNVPGRLIRNPLSSDARLYVFGRGTSGDSGYGFSTDEGESWDYMSGIFMRIASQEKGWGSTNFTHYDWVVGAGNMIGTVFSLSAPTGRRWAFGRTFNDSASGDVAQIAILDPNGAGILKAIVKADNTIIATNGRNYQYFSKDGGRTWFPS